MPNETFLKKRRSLGEKFNNFSPSLATLAKKGEEVVFRGYYNSIHIWIKNACLHHFSFLTASIACFGMHCAIGWAVPEGKMKKKWNAEKSMSRKFPGSVKRAHRLGGVGRRAQNLVRQTIFPKMPFSGLSICPFFLAVPEGKMKLTRMAFCT